MGKYLDFYKKCMKRGARLPRRFGISPNGLCYDAIVGAGVREWFDPDSPVYCDLAGRNGGWWGTEIKYTDDPIGTRSTFCALRQNLILLLACIHEEDFNELKK